METARRRRRQILCNIRMLLKWQDMLFHTHHNQQHFHIVGMLDHCLRNDDNTLSTITTLSRHNTINPHQEQYHSPQQKFQDQPFHLHLSRQSESSLPPPIHRVASMDHGHNGVNHQHLLSNNYDSSHSRPPIQRRNFRAPGDRESPPPQFHQGAGMLNHIPEQFKHRNEEQHDMTDRNIASSMKRSSSSSPMMGDEENVTLGSRGRSIEHPSRSGRGRQPSPLIQEHMILQGEKRLDICLLTLPEYLALNQEEIQWSTLAMNLLKPRLVSLVAKTDPGKRKGTCSTRQHHWVFMLLLNTLLAPALVTPFLHRSHLTNPFTRIRRIVMLPSHPPLPLVPAK